MRDAVYLRLTPTQSARLGRIARARTVPPSKLAALRLMIDEEHDRVVRGETASVAPTTKREA